MHFIQQRVPELKNSISEPKRHRNFKLLNPKRVVCVCGSLHHKHHSGYSAHVSPRGTPHGLPSGQEDQRLRPEGLDGAMAVAVSFKPFLRGMDQFTFKAGGLERLEVILAKKNPQKDVNISLFPTSRKCVQAEECLQPDMAPDMSRHWQMTLLT